MAYSLISAAHKSSGKTTISVGLSAALKERGLNVQPFKKGPDYIDPLWLGAAAGRSCRNLDFFTMSKPMILEMFHKAMVAADIGIIEANKGLYDGLDLDGSNSNAALASLLGAPVVLVIDARGMTRGIAPLILGYQAFDPEIKIKGVILNKVGGSRHESKLCNVINHYTDVPVIGSVHYQDDLQIDERHLGLMPNNEQEDAQAKISVLRQAIKNQVDIDQFIAISETAVKLQFIAQPVATTIKEKTVRIAYPRDKAFGFYYPEDLAVMEQEGATLIPFDMLQDGSLPKTDGLFIGGGFPETAMQALEANVSMRNAVKDFIENDGPVYAECGGLMYLARSLTWENSKCNMAGVIPGDVVMYPKPQGRGYVKLKETGHSPWPGSMSSASDGIICGHEFHYSTLENLDPTIQFAFEVKRGSGIDGAHDGLIYKNLIANYSHMRNVGRNQWAKQFIAFVRKCKK